MRMYQGTCIYAAQRSARQQAASAFAGSARSLNDRISIVGRSTVHEARYEVAFNRSRKSGPGRIHLMGHTGVPEQADAVGARSRSRFLQEAGLAGTAAFLLMMGVANNPLHPGAASAHSELAGLTDLDILNFALSLEHLEANFYREVLAQGKHSGHTLQFITAIRNHEQAHVTALTSVIKQLGGTPVAALAKYNFGDISTVPAYLATAETLEMTGVGAYTGAAPLIKDKKNILPAAASIEQVESRHYATIRLLRGMITAPTAFGPSLTVPQVQMAIKPIVG